MSCYSDKQCCCKCKFQHKVMKHPLNKEVGRGSISEVLGYCCHAPEIDDAVFFEQEHGICEMFEDKNKWTPKKKY